MEFVTPPNAGCVAKTLEGEYISVYVTTTLVYVGGYAVVIAEGSPENGWAIAKTLGNPGDLAGAIAAAGGLGPYMAANVLPQVNAYLPEFGPLDPSYVQPPTNYVEFNTAPVLTPQAINIGINQFYRIMATGPGGVGVMQQVAFTQGPNPLPIPAS